MNSRHDYRPYDRVERFDRRVEQVFEAQRDSEALNRSAAVVSRIADAGLITILVCLALGPQSARYRRLGVLMVCESLVVNFGIKRVVHRERPGNKVAATSSFPSGHTTMAASAFVALLPRGGVPLGILGGFLVGWSRVHRRLHHASDVIGGMILGVAAGRCIRWLVKS